MAVATLPDTLIDELVADRAAPTTSSPASPRSSTGRACPAPFPVHRWEDHIPQAVVLPTSAEQVSEVVKLANRHRVPVVPRAGGTGLDDGAVPLQARDPRRRQADGPDPRDRPRRPHGHRAAGINMLKLNEELRPARLHLSRQPGVLPVLAGRRADRHERLVADRLPLRAHPRPRHLLRDRAAHRRDHPGRRRRRQEGPQVLLGLPAQAAVHGRSRARSASSPRRRSSW